MTTAIIQNGFTGVGDVESSGCVGVVRLELQAHDVPIAGDLWGHVLSGERPERGGLWHPLVLHNEIVELRLYLEVTENEMDPIAWLSDNEPDAVHVVPVLLWVVRGQDDARRRGEIEEAGNCQKNRNREKCEDVTLPNPKWLKNIISWEALQKHRWPLFSPSISALKGLENLLAGVSYSSPLPPFAETCRELNRSFRADRDINLDLVTFNAYLLDQREADDRGVNLFPIWAPVPKPKRVHLRRLR